MAGKNYTVQHDATLSELRDLRVWRAFLVEARGVCRDLESLRFTLGMPLDDAMAAFGLGGSAWACERWSELRAAMDLPVEDPLAGSDELPAAA